VGIQRVLLASVYEVYAMLYADLIASFWAVIPTRRQDTICQDIVPSDTGLLTGKRFITTVTNYLVHDTNPVLLNQSSVPGHVAQPFRQF
jgi:hypothetical protein